MINLDAYFHNSARGRYAKIGEGSPILLLHGFAETYKMWEPIIEDIQKQFTVIIPEIPSCGNQYSLGETFSMEVIADFVHEIVEGEGIEQIILMGHSMGGYAAMAFAEKYPTKLIGLSLIHSTAKEDSAEKKQTRQEAISFIEKNGKIPFIKALMPKLYSPSFKGFEKEKKWHFDMAMEYSEEQIIACYKAMQERKDRTYLLANQSFPIQYLVGTNDLSIPYPDILEQVCTSQIADLTIFRSVGHTSYLENPLLLKQCIIRYCYDIYNHFSS
jgi:pimeloyl-ACP methyl ester carboxylesterase